MAREANQTSVNREYSTRKSWAETKDVNLNVFADAENVKNTVFNKADDAKTLIWLLLDVFLL